MSTRVRTGHEIIDAETGVLELDWSAELNQIISAQRGNKIISGCAPSASVGTNLSTSADDISITSGEAIINGTKRTISAQSVSLDGADADFVSGEGYNDMIATEFVFGMVYLDASGNIKAIGGTASTNPKPPALPANICVIALYLLTQGTTVFTNDDFRDFRMFVANADYFSTIYGGALLTLNATAVNVTGNQTIAGTLDVSGATSLSGTLILPNGVIAIDDQSPQTFTQAQLVNLNSINQDIGSGDNVTFNKITVTTPETAYASANGLLLDESNNLTMLSASNFRSALGIQGSSDFDTLATKLDKLIGIGASNSKIISLSPTMSDDNSKYKIGVSTGSWSYTLPDVNFQSTGALYMYFDIQLPVNIGDYHLYIESIQFKTISTSPSATLSGMGLLSENDVAFLDGTLPKTWTSSTDGWYTWTINSRVDASITTSEEYISMLAMYWSSIASNFRFTMPRLKYYYVLK